MTYDSTSTGNQYCTATAETSANTTTKTHEDRAKTAAKTASTTFTGTLKLLLCSPPRRCSSPPRRPSPVPLRAEAPSSPPRKTGHYRKDQRKDQRKHRREDPRGPRKDTLELLPSSPNPPSPSWGRASVTTHDAGQPHYFRRLPIIVTCAASGVHSEA